MGKLYGWLVALVLVFTVSMACATWSVYALEWEPGAAAGIVFLVFLAGAAVIPGPLRALSGPRFRTGKALVQAFASVCGVEFFTMALVTWILGKRFVPQNNAYDTLGLLIFLGLLGVGAQGVVAMTFRFVYVRNRELV
ncbi:MAG: hypothetical protein ACRDYZ_10250, partial [Acidimicrobiales bacterium]